MIMDLLLGVLAVFTFSVVCLSLLVAFSDWTDFVPPLPEEPEEPREQENDE
jgi:hypothetical protein